MKKIIVILIVFFSAFFSKCEKNETESEPEPSAYQPKEVQEFLNSEDFKKNECFFANYGQMGIGEVEWLQIYGDSAYQLIIPLLDNLDKKTITAYLQVSKVPEGELPNDEVYFMNLIDLKDGFDNLTLTGDVVMLGINYDAFQHSELTVENNIIVSSEYPPFPKEYLEEIAAKNKLRDFLSCYRHTRQAMDNDDTLFFVCDVTGWVMPVCSMSAAAYCIFGK
ncbi:MAG: hypothetical protein NTZ83_00310 [Candidatus Pacearchaeota archaeon]|nr:hypothetical protein [Candidatus Pacearchaeota archaeon]